jgi:hypothetical protein
MVRHGRKHDRTGGAPLRIALLALLLAAPAAEGQVVVVGRQPTGGLAGTVVNSHTGSPVSYALLRLPALGVERFADDAGAFDFSGVPSGPHRVIVTQPGYVPRDTIVWIDTTRSVQPPFRLVPVGIDVAMIPVTVSPRCRAPQAEEDEAPTDFQELLEQVMHNAERYRVLSSSYPFAATYERVWSDHAANGSTKVVDTDSSIFRSVDAPRYRPGDVARLALRAAREPDWAIRVPTMLDVASPDFRRFHCFSFGGYEDLAGETLARVDFTVAEWVSTPDVDGSVYIDPLYFNVRGMRASLTRIPIRGIDSLTVTTLYREMAPNLLVPTQISSATYYRPSRGNQATALVARTETQWLIQMGFLGRAPGSLLAEAPEQERR